MTFLIVFDCVRAVLQGCTDSNHLVRGKAWRISPCFGGQAGKSHVGLGCGSEGPAEIREMPPAAPFHQLGSGWGWRDAEMPGWALGWHQYSPPDLPQGASALLRGFAPKHLPVTKLSVPFLPFGDNYHAPLQITPFSTHFNIYPLRIFACKYFIWQLLPACCCQKCSSMVKGLRLLGQPGVLVTCHKSPAASRGGSCSQNSWGASLVFLAGLSFSSVPCQQGGKLKYPCRSC